MGNLKQSFCAAEEVFWQDIKEQVKKVNPQLFQLIENIKPNHKYPLIKVRYAYGEKIVAQGKFQFAALERFQPQLDYSAIPLGLVLHHAGEVFIEQQNHIVPLNYFLPGDLFGVFEVVDLLRGKKTEPMWTVTSGARSFFMLPKISDYAGHQRLKRKYSLKADAPQQLLDQWQVFRELAHNNGGIKDWYQEVIFFTKSWFAKENNNKAAWANFYLYLRDYCLTQLDYLRVYTETDLLWQLFTTAISNKGLRPRAYLINTVKHLISIANGIALGFRPALDVMSAPLPMLQDVYINDYGLKDYQPIFMQPYKIKTLPAYYSLSLPTILGASPYTKTPTNIIDDQRDLKRLLDTLQMVINKMNGSEYNKTIALTIKNTEFSYFHATPDLISGIQSSQKIPLLDENFIGRQKTYANNKKFCATSQFMKGCLKISVAPLSN